MDLLRNLNHIKDIHININRILLPVVLSTFTLTYGFPLPAQQFNIGINEVAFMIYEFRKMKKMDGRENIMFNKFIA